MPALIGVVLSFLAKLLGDNLLRWVAVKASMLFLFVVILPLILNNLIGDLLKVVFDLVGSNTTGISSLSPTFSMTGLAAWFAECLQVSQCIAVIASALLLRATLKMIPFIKL